MVQVIKATGEVEPFSEEKLRGSIHRAGIPDELENKVVEQIQSKLYDKIPTSEIYRNITNFLGSSKSPYTKAKYSLKESIMSLGPTGYPFEDFIAEVLKTEGYKTQTRVVVKGRCISHEIDVIAEKDGEKNMIEAKFHNTFGARTDSQVAMYTKTRFDDVKDQNYFTSAWLITNTKATLDAISYGTCSGMKIISWSYPDGQSLRELIEKARLQLITSLSLLSNSQKQRLLENHIILCKDIVEKPNCLDLLVLPRENKDKILSEAQFVYKN